MIQTIQVDSLFFLTGNILGVLSFPSKIQFKIIRLLAKKYFKFLVLIKWVFHPLFNVSKYQIIHVIWFNAIHIQTILCYLLLWVWFKNVWIRNQNQISIIDISLKLFPINLALKMTWFRKVNDLMILRLIFLVIKNSFKICWVPRFMQVKKKTNYKMRRHFIYFESPLDRLICFFLFFIQNLIVFIICEVVNRAGKFHQKLAKTFWKSIHIVLWLGLHLQRLNKY